MASRKGRRRAGAAAGRRTPCCIGEVPRHGAHEAGCRRQVL